MISLISYSISSGRILGEIPSDQDPDVFFEYYSTEDRKDIGVLRTDLYSSEIPNYKVVDGNMVKYSDSELDEISLYGRVLTVEQREGMENQTPPKTNVELKKDVEDLREILDIMLGGVE